MVHPYSNQLLYLNYQKNNILTPINPTKQNNKFNRNPKLTNHHTILKIHLNSIKRNYPKQ